MAKEFKPPICPLCKIRERSFDGEPPVYGDERDYFSHCYECSSLCGTRDHTHTYYGSPAQVAAGTFKAGQSWRTTVALNPIMENGKHIGFRCVEFDRCGWEQRFTAADMELCPDVHKDHYGITYPAQYKVLCERYNTEHRLERGEIEPLHGYITEHGKRVQRERTDAANWDPGRYIER